MNYAKLYAIVCGAASDAVELIDRGNFEAARACLLAALEEAEELYIRGERIMKLFEREE